MLNTYICRSVSSNERGSYGSKSHLQQDVTDLCGKLSPTIERLALLNEVSLIDILEFSIIYVLNVKGGGDPTCLSQGKLGHNLKVFQRLATTVKEMAIQKCL